ncbi:putative polygalacturonase [Citrus sinensis]|uniref:Polygalacturonase n=1 Tax=Citrus sinensis TaxID=2711 RepID=A0ACB8JBM4_CITSI|nr:putative polygalacturonase [Citrus sinensis]
MKQLKFCSFSTFFIVLIHVLVCLSASLVSTEGFDSLLELPHSGSNRTRSKSKRVIFVGDFGAKGDGFNDDTEAFANAWKKACSFPARTKIVFSAGYTFLIHPIDISGPCKSRLTLKISGTIVAPKDPDVWKGLNRRRWLYFNRVNHLTVQGGGTINGMGQEWWSRSCKINTTNPCRHAPTVSAASFLSNAVCSADLSLASFSTLFEIKYFSPLTLPVIAPAESPNTDGIHISASRGVEVKNSIVGTGDDCISIVGNSSLIRIRNFACGPGHGISIGSLGKSNSSVRIHDIMVYGALISNTQNGVRIKTWQGGSGSATNIQFLDVLMKNVSNPIIIDQYYCDSPVPCANQTSAVKVENITFIHIKGTSATEEAIKFACSDDSPCEGLFLEDVQLVSHSGGIAKSFCWEAYGSSVGQVEPPPCFACSEGLIQQKAPSNLAFQSF